MERLAVVFGGRVRALREARGLTQEELAKASGLGPKHIGVIERGEKTSSFEAVERLAKALEVPYHELFLPLAQRRTKALDKELTDLANSPNRIDVTKVEDFLRALRGAVRKLDKNDR